MSVIKSLFGKKTTPPSGDPAFEQLVCETLARYHCEPGASVEPEFRDNDGNRIPASVALPDAYAKCRNIQSIWDKRSVLYETFDHLYPDQLEPWKRIERFNYDRYPQKALNLLKESDDVLLQDPDFLSAISRSYFFCANYPKAIQLAKAALDIRPGDPRALLALADAEHLNGNHETAHEIYGKVLQIVMEGFDKSAVSVVELTDYHQQLMHSSVYAIALLQDSQTPDETWTRVAEEFYHCPYFRTMHGFQLIRKGDHLKGIVKLLNTAKEFPWYKDAVLNAHSSMLQFRKQTGDASLWQEEIGHLEQIIRHYGWQSLQL